MKDGDIENWAECKSYTGRLSFHVISPTLIMAMLENVGKIIFFSRSEFNSNALEVLGRYSTRVAKEVLVYDGAALLSLVFQHTNLVRRFFAFAAAPKSHHRPLYSSISLTRDAYLATVNLAPREERVRAFGMPLYSILRLDVTIRNPNTDIPLIAAVKVEEVPRELKIILGPLSTEIELAPGEVSVVQIFLKAVAPGNRVLLPSVTVVESGLSETAVRHLEEVPIQITRLYQVPLIGEQFRALTEQFEGAICHRTRPLVFTIVGQSGVGKSRLLQELAALGIAQGHMVQLFESELSFDLSADQLIRQFLATTNELPLFANHAAVEYCSQLTQHEVFGNSEASLLKTIMEILYNPCFSPSENHNATLGVIKFSILKRPTILLIDNVQNRDDKFSELLQRLVHEIGDIIAQFVLVLCFNRDFVLPGSRAASLLQQLESVRYSGSQRNFFWEINEFNREDAAEFLDNALAGSRDQKQAVDLKRTMKLFLDYVQPRPLNIWQGLMYLVDRGVLALIDDVICVVDPAGFRSELSNIPKGLRELFVKRWRLILNNGGRSGICPNDLERTIRILYLLGAAAPEDLNKFGIQSEYVYFLVRSGIFSLRSGGSVEFFHFQVFLFFRAEYREIPKEEALQIQSAFRKLRYSSRLYEQALIVSHFAENLTPRQLREIVKSFINRYPTREHGIDFCQLLKIYLLRVDAGHHLSASKLIALRKVSDYVLHAGSFREGMAAAEDICLLVSQRFKGRPRNGEELLDIFHSMANAYLATFQDGKALEVLDFALSRIHLCHFRDEYSRKKTHCKLLNRRMAARKALGLKRDALDDAAVGISLAREIGDYDLHMQNYLDCAGIYSTFPESRNLARQYWEAGLKVYREWVLTGGTKFHPRGAYTEGLLLLLDGDFDAAARLLGPAARLAEQQHNPFWAIRLLLLDVCRMLMQGDRSEGMRAQIKYKLAEAQDLWNVSGVLRLGWRVSYLYAKWALAFEDGVEAARAVRRTLIQLENSIKDHPLSIERHTVLLRDIAVCAREASWRPDSESLDWLPLSTREEIRLILEMSDEDFESFRRQNTKEILLANSQAQLAILE